MNLAIDTGNTRIHYAIFTDGVVVRHGVCHDDDLVELCSVVAEENPEQAILCSVRKRPDSLERCLSNISVRHLTKDTPLPITIDYSPPEKLGMDRMAAAVGAQALFPNKNVLIIDAGTCITIDHVGAEGSYHGGLIAPGISMQYKALHADTGALPLLEHECRTKYPGQSPDASIHAGVNLNVKFLVKGMIDQVKEDNPDLGIVLTGGDAAAISELIADENRIFTAPLLVLMGLNEILRYNS